MESNKESSKTNKGVVVLLVIIVMALAAVLGVLYSKMKDQEKEKVEIQEVLEGQKQRLENELLSLQSDFGKLETNNDSLKTLATEQQDRITRLLAINADNAFKIRTYQKELETLRTILVDLYYRVDSLHQMNVALSREKEEIARNLRAEQTQTRRLTEEREQLTSTVQRALVLSVSDIKTIGLNSKGSETPRVRNIDKLQTSFMIRENAVATAGERIFYLVIIKPDKRPLTNPHNAYFTTHEGVDIVFTDRRTIDYNNVDLEARIFSDNNGRLTEGRYDVRIYCDGYLVGSSSFVLR